MSQLEYLGENVKTVRFSKNRDEFGQGYVLKKIMSKNVEIRNRIEVEIRNRIE